jgi:hypothetical protein
VLGDLGLYLVSKRKKEVLGLLREAGVRQRSQGSWLGYFVTKELTKFDSTWIWTYSKELLKLIEP